MAWPTPSDYSEAVQSPQTSFSDPELKHGQVDTNKLGLPIPISGNFAVVFKFHCNGRDWAVRCFVRDVPDQQQRYTAISDYLKQVNLPYTLGFVFLTEGIRIRGQWYPVLKMEWISGQSLIEYVQQNLYDSAELLRLAGSWMQMSDVLHKASVAHGDLQDGNVVVSNRLLKLIDYDGMYVPALTGRVSNETGHRNYQHPSRSATDYGMYLDNFSDWVIYVSIIALAIDPTLWIQLNAGDECLLFRKDDFLPQNQSSALTLMSEHSDHRLRNLASVFKSLLYLQPSQIPTLATNESIEIAPSKPNISNNSGASWLDDYVTFPKNGSYDINPSTVEQSLNTGQSTPTASPNWILDSIAPTIERKSFNGSISRLRMIIIALMVLMLIISLLNNMNIELLGEPILSVIILFLPYIFYKRHPLSLERTAAIGAKKQQQQLLMEYEAEIKEYKDLKTKRDEAQQKASLEAQEKVALLKEQARQEKLWEQNSYKKKLDAIATREQQLSNALQKLKFNHQSSLDRINQQIMQLEPNKQAEIKTSLQQIQIQFIEKHLRTADISTSHIYGIGPQLAANLVACGFVTAADINKNIHNVYGIGSAKATALISWRQKLEREAIRMMPTSLPDAQMNTVTTKFDMQRTKLQQAIIISQSQFVEQERHLKKQNDTILITLKRERSTSQQHFQQAIRNIDAKYSPVYDQIIGPRVKQVNDYEKQQIDLYQKIADRQKAIYNQTWQLAKAQQELDAFQDITFQHFVRCLWRGEHRL